MSYAVCIRHNVNGSCLRDIRLVLFVYITMLKVDLREACFGSCLCILYS